MGAAGVVAAPAPPEVGAGRSAKAAEDKEDRPGKGCTFSRLHLI